MRQVKKPTPRLERFLPGVRRAGSRGGGGADSKSPAMRSSMEEYLQAELGEGTRESSGAFTLARAQALEKLAGFQMPGPHTWVLKVVQASVASGCSALTVRQNSTESIFVFCDAPGWSVDQVEEAFCQPGTVRDRGLRHLRQALWNVGISGLRPFYVTGAGWPEALVWDGRSLSQRPTSPVTETTLVVSHRVWQKGRGFPILRSIEAAERNAEVLLELKQKAFVCPIPLRLDGLRLDALQLCPSHGLSSRSSLLRLAFPQGPLPPLGIPPATAGGFVREGEMRADVDGIYQGPVEIPESAALMCLLSAHVMRLPDGKSHKWSTARQPSLLYWVLDGVVLNQANLSVPSRCCSLAVMASAEGLITDLSGFTLQINAEYRERLWKVYELAAEFAARVRVDFSGVMEKQPQSLWARLWHGSSNKNTLADELSQALGSLRREWADFEAGFKNPWRLS